MISPRQVRAARALLGWTQAELGRRAGLSEQSVNNVESGSRDFRASTLARIERALMEDGIRFSADGGEGVSLATPRHAAG